MPILVFIFALLGYRPRATVRLTRAEAIYLDARAIDARGEWRR